MLFRATCAAVGLLCVAIMPASGGDCKNGICVEAHCPSKLMEIWATTEGDVLWSESGNRPLNVTGFNVRGGCFSEQQEIGLQAGALRMQPGCGSFEIQACEKGEETLFVRSPSRCSVWSEFNVSCPTPPPPPPPPPVADVCAGRLGTEGCPFPSFGDKAQGDFVAFCQDYTDKALAAVAEAQQLKCGKSGDRWTPDASAHANWCVSLNGDPSRANAETAARSDELAACRRAKNITIKSIGRAKLTTFAGSWRTIANGGSWSFDMTFAQDGAEVSGDFVVIETGVRGTLTGSASGNALNFNWNDLNGYAGTGTLRLSENGRSFSGTYVVTYIPEGLTADLLQGTWEGKRK
jgi:hypothetical protein